MSTTHAANSVDNAANPMKKRFRSWVPEEQPPTRRRRYPRLVFRDSTGNYVVNRIDNAPMVELPPKPVVPSSVTVPTAPRDGGVNHMNTEQESPSAVTPRREDSLELSTSTRDHGAQEETERPRSHSPSSPLLAKSTANNIESTFRDSGCNPGARSPRPVNTPVPSARVNPMHEHPQQNYSSPEYALRPRSSGGVPSPYVASSCTQTPPSVVPSEVQAVVPYGGQPTGPVAPQRVDQYQPQTTAQHTPPRYYGYEPQATNCDTQQPTPVATHPLETAQQAEKVILAGRRCGTVEYWRSSLQMPRERGVVKSVKAPVPVPVQPKRRMKPVGPEQAFVIHPPAPATHPPSTLTPPPGPGSAYPLQQPIYPSDEDLNSPKRPGTELEHEFWRSATKLPRAQAETTRVRKLAHGRRRIDGSNMAYVESPVEDGPGHMTNDAVDIGSPFSGQYNQHSAPMHTTTQANYASQGQSEIAHTVAPGQVVPSPQRPQANGQPIAPRPPSAASASDRATRSKAESETRRLLFLRDFELRRLRTLAQSKFHVKMNLRGRMKLEQWVCSDPLTIAAADLIVSMFNLDRRVLSKNDDIRRNSLYDMTNEDLRILEALMSRVTSRGGRTNWALLTSSLSPESFIKTLPTEEP